MKRLSFGKTLIIGFSLSAVPFAQAGTSSGGGGDLAQIAETPVRLLDASRISNFRIERIKGYLAKDAKSDLVRVLGRGSVNPKVLVADLPEQFRPLAAILKGWDDDYDAFVRDIQGTRYALSDQPVYATCGDQDGKEKDAATCGERLSEVRFNVRKIARYDLPWPQLKLAILQLVFHEHVRHWGYADNQHILARMAGLLENKQKYSEAEVAYLKAPPAYDQDLKKNPAWIEYEKLDVILSGVSLPESVTYMGGYESREGVTRGFFRNLSKRYEKAGFGVVSPEKIEACWKAARQAWPRVSVGQYEDKEAAYSDLSNALVGARTGVMRWENEEYYGPGHARVLPCGN